MLKMNLIVSNVYRMRSESVLVVKPEHLDFGRVNIHSPPVSSWITVANEGAVPLRFSVDIGPHVLELRASPHKGRVKAYHSQQVRIQFIPRCEGNYKSEFW